MTINKPFENLNPTASAATTPAPAAPAASAEKEPLWVRGIDVMAKAIFNRWVMATTLAWCGLFLWNATQEFNSTSGFQYVGGAWRNAGARIADVVRHKEMSTGFDIVGHRFAVYYVGDRKFIQLVSGGPAVEVLQ